MFLNYDLLARRWVPYSYVYPYAETGAGLLMIPAVATWLSAPVALFIGSVGAFSVFKAVYIDKRELKCACVGGGSGVPLGFISLTENLAMVAMAIWMASKALVGRQRRSSLQIVVLRRSRTASGGSKRAVLKSTRHQLHQRVVLRNVERMSNMFEPPQRHGVRRARTRRTRRECRS